MTKSKEIMETRQANVEDFKVGTVLITKEGSNHKIVNQQVGTVWGTERGGCVFADEFHIYRVAI